MPRQAEGGDSTRSLDRKEVNKTRGKGLVRTSASWSLEKMNRI